MKRLLLLCLCLLWLPVRAESLSLDLRGVTVPEFAEVVLKSVLRRDYMLGSGIAAAEPKLTISVASIERDQVLPLAVQLLDQYGITLDMSAPVVRIYRATVAPASDRPATRVGQTDEAAKAAGMLQPATALPLQQQPVEEIAVYRPRGKTVEFLAMVAKLGGVQVPEVKGRNDVLVFGGDADKVAKVRKLLADVDTVTPGLMVRAALVEFSESHSDARSLSLALTALAGKLGLVYQAGAQLTNAITFTGSTLKAALSAIEGDSRFRYVAEPQVRVMDGERARLVVGSEVPTRGVATLDKNGNPVASVQYRTAGVIITVEPRVMDGSIIVKVGQQISSFATTTTSNIDSPTIMKREAETTVRAAPGELIILAGMDESRHSAGESGFSFLPSFLRSSTKDTSRSQLVLFLEVVPESGNPI